MSNSAQHIFNPPQVHPPQPSYSHICITSLGNGMRLLTLAGQIGRDSETGNIPSTLAAQVEVALKNVGKCLEASNAKITDIVRVQQFVVDLLSQDSSRAQAYLKFMGEHRPPSTLIGVNALAGKELLYEIEVTAVAKE
ncbi:hypothetical protein LTR09_012518 [Extremus antarcticus]|uniref:YjgF-like protein n=1 Tax=Extremus antarcticus TaxID=702011 RepID=A0AAJ0D9W7_9PEZI|nr:hypothetical protein LTR09_012518 [Extremus antarcticus]